MEDYGLRVFGTEPKLTKDVTITEHLSVLEVASYHCDSAVSKTCNVPSDMPFTEFKQVYMDAWTMGIKGVTTFNIEGKRFGIMREIEGEACYIDPNTGEKTCA